MAISNKHEGKNIDTVLFFDEANTTEALGMIKEIMVDRRCNGRPLSESLKFIVACNPYRKWVLFLQCEIGDYEVKCNKGQTSWGKQLLSNWEERRRKQLAVWMALCSEAKHCSPTAPPKTTGDKHGILSSR